MNRRAFLRWMAWAGGASAASLAACVRRPLPTAPTLRPGAPVRLPIRPGNEPIADGLPPETGATLRIYGWPYYVKPALLRRFEQKERCRIAYRSFRTMEGALAYLRTGLANFDVFFPQVDVVGPLVEAGMLRPLNHTYLPHLDNVWRSLRDPFYDRGCRYTVPYFVWTTGIAWRNDLLDEDPRDRARPYEVFWDPMLAGRVHLLNNPRDLIALALLREGIRDVNTEDAGLIEKAKNVLLDLIDAVQPKLDHTDYRDLFTDAVYVHQSWSGNIGFAHLTAPSPKDLRKISYWWPPATRPEIPGVIGSDTIAILRSAEHPVLAHRFIDFLLREDNALENSAYEGYQQPLEKLRPEEFVEAGIVPPHLDGIIVREQDFLKGLQLTELSPAADRLWQLAYEEVADAAARARR